MKILTPLLISATLFGAPSGIYIEANLDNPTSAEVTVDTKTYSYDKGLSGTFALGYQMEDVRFEVEGNYSTNELKQTSGVSGVKVAVGDITQMGGLANVYYSAYNDTQLVSSIGMGVGMTSIETSNLKEASVVVQDLTSKTSLTYQGTLSLGYMINEDWTASVKYRYLEIEDFDNDNHGISLGLRYMF